MQSSAVQASRPPVGNIVWDIVLNALFPVLLYKLSKRYISHSEFTALLCATSFPLGKSVFDLLRRGLIDPVSIIVLLGIATDGVAMLFGGGPRVLLVRESLFTGAFGVACLISLLLPRPMMFYFGRHFVAGANPERRARFDASWRLSEVRFGNRLITGVWGCVYVAELILRIALIYSVSVATVLIISPILLGALTVITLIWTFRYGRQLRLRALAQPD